MRTVIMVLGILAAAGPASAPAQERDGTVGFNRNDRVLTWQSRNRGNFTLSPFLGVSLENLLSSRDRKSVV